MIMHHAAAFSLLAVAFAKERVEWGNATTCGCVFQGGELPSNVYNNYPSDEPGKYKDMKVAHIYGSQCGAWDQMPGSPWHDSCTQTENGKGRDWSTSGNNWCQVPWCYVDCKGRGPMCEGCKGAFESDVFKGSPVAWYSFLTCAAPDCYTTHKECSSESGEGCKVKPNPWKTVDAPVTDTCPYDPSGTKTYRLDTFDDRSDETDNCKCLYHGSQLSPSIYENYPNKDPKDCRESTASDQGTCKKEPGMYAEKEFIAQYGTSCVAWDQIPGTPWDSYCPPGADFCNQDFNWCQQPWCYVSKDCKSAVPSSVFQGYEAAAYYSYETCLGTTPDCYTNIAWAGGDALDDAPKGCPFDSHVNGWFTKQECPAHENGDWRAPGWTVQLPNKQSCGGVKAEWQEQGCCGKENRHKDFSFGE